MHGFHCRLETVELNATCLKLYCTWKRNVVIITVKWIVRPNGLYKYWNALNMIKIIIQVKT